MTLIIVAALLAYVCVWAVSNTVGLDSLGFTPASVFAVLLWLATAWICFTSARYKGKKTPATTRAEQKRRERERGNFTEQQQIENFHCMSRGLGLMLIPQGFLVVYFPLWVKLVFGVLTLIVGLLIGSVWGMAAGRGLGEHDE